LGLVERHAGADDAAVAHDLEVEVALEWIAGLHPYERRTLGRGDVDQECCSVVVRVGEPDGRPILVATLNTVALLETVVREGPERCVDRRSPAVAAEKSARAFVRSSVLSSVVGSRVRSTSSNGSERRETRKVWSGSTWHRASLAARFRLDSDLPAVPVDADERARAVLVLRRVAIAPQVCGGATH
jgi:hypothetical protein